MAMETTLILSSLFFLVSAGAFAYVGYRVGRRRVEGPAHTATVAFAVWWFGLALLNTHSALLHFLAAGGWLTLPFYTTMLHLTSLILCVLLWGLVYYLAYLLTGRRWTIWPLAALYAVIYVFFVWYISAAHPIGFEVETWRIRTIWADTDLALSGAMQAFVLLAILAPPLSGAIGYFRLWFKVKGATERYRIGLVSLTILAWFGSALAASLLLGPDTGEAAQASWQVASRIIGLVAAFAILMAYQPPRWVRERYGVRAVDESPWIEGP